MSRTLFVATDDKELMVTQHDRGVAARANRRQQAQEWLDDVEADVPTHNQQMNQAEGEMPW